MARLVAVCRDGEEEFPFEKRQIPLYIDDTLTVSAETPPPPPSTPSGRRGARARPSHTGLLPGLLLPGSAPGFCSSLQDFPAPAPALKSRKQHGEKVVGVLGSARNSFPSDRRASVPEHECGAKPFFLSSGKEPC